MGVGYGLMRYGAWGGDEPRTLPQTYGPKNPGQDFARALMNADEMKKEEAATQTEEEERPLREALLRAAGIRQGIYGPGMGGPSAPGGGGGPTSTPPPPPAGSPPPGRMGGGGGGGDRITMPNGQPAPGAQPASDVYTVPPHLQGTAHALPGAFNPFTGTHNPADIPLGGGFFMSGGMTPDAVRARRESDYASSGIPGMTPQLAHLLATEEDPNKAAALIQMLEGRANPTKWEPHTREEALQFYRDTHPEAEGVPRPMTLAEAMREVDRDPAAASLSVVGRRRLAEQMMSGKFDTNEDANLTHHADRGLFGKGGAATRAAPRHVTKDQQAYLQHTGAWDPTKYTVDPD